MVPADGLSSDRDPVIRARDRHRRPHLRAGYSTMRLPAMTMPAPSTGQTKTRTELTSVAASGVGRPHRLEAVAGPNSHNVASDRFCGDAGESADQVLEQLLARLRPMSALIEGRLRISAAMHAPRTPARPYASARGRYRSRARHRIAASTRPSNRLVSTIRSVQL